MSRQREVAKYLTIKYYSDNKHWDVQWMCQQLEISRSGYYKWLHRESSVYEKECGKALTIIREYDEKFNHILGYRRMTDWINHFNNTKYSMKFIHCLMSKAGIHSVIRPKRKKYLKSTPEITSQNILKRDFLAKSPNEKWATDVTEFKIIGSNEKVYLSAIIDLYDRSIISYVLSNRNDNKLVFDTFDKAIGENPNAHPVFHTDRGFQYTSKVFGEKLKSASMTSSMSRIGHCIDNGPCEGLWGIIKSECYYLNKYHDKQSLVQSLEQYISFYNNERVQERFGNKTPIEVRNEALKACNDVKQYPIAINKRILKYKEKWVNKNTAATDSATAA